MLRTLIHKFLKHRHFWRHASFDEVGQIYVSMLFRSLALSLIGVFVPIYLYQLGYPLEHIFAFFMSFFIVRSIVQLPAGYLVAMIGPKHTIVVSYLFQVVTSLFFLTLPTVAWPLFAIASVWAISNTLFFTAYHVDFSKVKHSDHGGKELGFADIMQRVGGVIGPLVGGIVATVAGAEYIFLATIILLFVGLVPLLSTPEPVRTHQHISFRSLDVRPLGRDIVSFVGLTINHQLSVTLWPLFLGLYALGTQVYLELGALTSIGFLVSMFAAFSIGKLVDNHRGGELLRYSALADAIGQLLRPFVNTLPFALVMNVAHETFGTAMRIPYHKGMYDRADTLRGQRIVYVATLEMCGAFAKAVLWLLLLMIGVMIDFKVAMVCGFIIAAGANLLTTKQSFPALATNKKM
jgi:MFS family permease